MTEAWTPLCLVPACDLDSATWPLPVVVVDDNLVFRRDGAEIGFDAVYPLLTAAIGRSSRGRALLDRVEADCAQPRGASLAALRLETKGDPAPALVGRLAQDLSQAQERITRQMRELAALRGTVEQGLTHFARLEAFFYGQAKGERHLSLTLPPEPRAPLMLEGEATCRLPSDSVGLSDVALHLPEPAEGRLEVRLILFETGAEVGHWDIDLAGREPGWLRLGLHRALPVDACTPLLRLTRHGAPLALSLSYDHPDPRFHAPAAPGMLAVKLWTHVPGLQAPMAALALPVGVSGPVLPPERWTMTGPELAELLAQPLGEVGVISTGPDGQAVVCLPGLARKGMGQLRAEVSVEAGLPALEAALGLAPKGGPRPEIATGPWTRIEPGSAGQLVHFHPATEPGDLWVFVRLPPDVVSAAQPEQRGLMSLVRRPTVTLPRAALRLERLDAMTVGADV